MAAYAWEKLTVSTTALNATDATSLEGTHGHPKGCLITVETNSIRVRFDGGVATAANGHVLAAGDSLRLTSAGDVANLSMIRVSADATVQITFER